MVIAFIHSNASFLPEIKAYHRFFSQYNIQCVSAPFSQANQIRADVLWYIMGFSLQKNRNVVTIHEYTSASAPPYAGMKDTAKKWLQPKPDYRIFLNPYVRGQVSPDDQVPFGYRDMAVDFSIFYRQPESAVVYDFIYTGNLHRSRHINQLLECFASGTMRKHSLLIISKNYEALARKYAGADNIYFKGPVPQEAVCTYLNQAAFAINYMPDREPYNQQTSTKLLEYAACGIPVVTTSYPWINQFMERHGGAYFFLDKDLDNFTWEAVHAFAFRQPDLIGYDWETQIRRSGVLHFLEEKFKGLLF
jgi:glycosyltransferase involved in cell wall biosynthesis